MLIEAGENLLLPAVVTALHFIDSALFKPNYYTGRAIRKVMGGGAGEAEKKYSRNGKLNEKKFMHAN